ncbi:MAG: hypothetical protein NVS4B12_14500 [Ktedonobacteraceae bacterium]
MSNNWRSENNQDFEYAAPRAGNLMREYHQQQGQQLEPPQSQPPQRYQEQAMPVFQNQYSPVVQDYGQQGPNQQIPQAPQNQHRWASNALQRVRQWSGKMVAQHYGQPEPPMVLRHAPQTPLPVTPVPPKAKRWKRSRTLRVAMQMRHRRFRWHSKAPQGGRIGIGILMALLLLLVIITSSTTAYAYGYYQSQLPRVQGLASQHVEQMTRMYDRNGVLLGDLFDPNGVGRRTPIEYKDLPQVMQDAMVAAEDKTFWTNSGIDPQGILRAGTEYLQHNSVQGGGSTLTQQLIKNLTGDKDLTLNRKLPEAALAIGLTQQYPKWKIMEMYFNVSPFGTLDLGVEAAAEEYFHLERTCDPKNFKCVPGISKIEYNQDTKKNDPILGLARASLLAGMPQSPVSYDPTNGTTARKLALIRQDEVLHNMLAAGMSVDGHPLSEAMIQQAEMLTAKMKFTRYKQTIKAPHFFEWAKQQLAVKLGHGNETAGLIALYTGGFNIRTTIDVNLEDYVEKAIDRHLNQVEYQPFPTGHYAILSQDNNVHNSAAVVMNAKTGEILAMDGSADYNAINDKKVDGQFNAAADAYRSPGSTWKPLVYTTAFEMGMYPGMVLPDVKTYFPNGGTTDIKNAYLPPDYGGTYVGGNNTIHVATANSRNVPAVKALQFAGIENVANTARRFGITALDEDIAIKNKTQGTHIKTVTDYNQLSFALGSMGVPLVQLTGAYQVFANQGLRIPPQSILDIWDNYGHNLYHYDATHPPAIRVISPQIAYLMTSILTDENARAAEFGNDHVLSFNDWDPTYQVHQVAAKTGTTDNFVDNWTMGYTPNVVVGVWSGNADNSPLINSVGVTGAAPIWHSIIERASGKPCDPTAPDWDEVPCGAFNPAPYNFTQGTFVVPTGIHQASTSSTDGLKGSGNSDWMLDGEDPTVYGIGSGPPPITNNNGGGTGMPTH